MAMEALSTVELHIIRAMLAKQCGPRSPFLDQLAAARVDRRRMTGVGIFVNLLITGNAAGVDQINTEISEDYPTLLAPPCDLVGFTLFIREGYLCFIEGYTFGDVKWPEDPMENWLVLDASRWSATMIDHSGRLLRGNHVPCHFDLAPYSREPDATVADDDADDQLWRRKLPDIWASHAA